MSMPISGAPQPTDNRPTTILILGILSLVCCPLTGPFAWSMGKKQLAAIRAGQAPAAGEQNSKVGMVLGIVGTVWMAFCLIWVVGFGGFAILSGLAGAAGQ